MGKSKKRSFSKNTANIGNILKRTEIIKGIISDIRNNSLNQESTNLITLFGITMEELSEAGASYEELSAVKHLII